MVALAVPCAAVPVALVGCRAEARRAEARPEEGPSASSAPNTSDASALERRVAVTFDDLPGNTFRPTTEAFRAVTTALVEDIVRHRIPAIGFVNEVKLYEDGRLIPERVAMLEAWVEGGLELGNHSFSHPDINTTPLEDFQEDVLKGEEITRALIEPGGGKPRYFRHPFLHAGASLEVRAAFEGFLREHGYRVAPVTIDNQEWIFARAYDHALDRAERALAERIGDSYLVYMDSIFGYYEAQSRAIVGYEIPQVLLLHANQLNADVLDGLVATIRRRGYEFVTLDEALEDEAYRLPDQYAGTSGITWLHRWALTQGKRGEFFAGEPEVPAFVQEVFDNPPP